MKTQEELKLGCSSLGEWLVKTRKILDGEVKDARVKTTGHMEEGVDSQGGFLVPEDWADGIYNASLEDAIVRPDATVLKSKADSLKVRTLVDSDRSSSIFGGITFKWIEEAAQKSSSDNISKPSLGELELNAKKLVGSCYVSNELESDWGGFGDFMTLSFGKALRFEEDDRFIWGTGAGQPLGVMNSGFLAQETRTSNDKVDFADLANMMTRLLPGCWGKAMWLVSPSFMSELMQATASAANQAAVWDASSMTLFGRPIIVTEKCSAMGTEGDVILADFSHYVIFDREMKVAGSRHVRFDYDETYWKVQLRVDGQPLLSSPITPKRGGDTLSAFVALTTNS